MRITTVPLGVAIVKDVAGHIVYATSEACALFGLRYNPAQRVFTPVETYEVLRPDMTNLGPHEFPSQRALRRQRPVEKVLGIRRFGVVRWFRLRAVPLFSAAGKLTGVRVTGEAVESDRVSKQEETG